MKDKKVIVIGGNGLQWPRHTTCRRRSFWFRIYLIASIRCYPYVALNNRRRC